MPQPTARGRTVGGVVVGVLTTATTALLAPTASADTPGAPTDLTCAVTTAGLPRHLAWGDVPAALHAAPTAPTGSAGSAVRDDAAVTPRGELTLRLPDRAGALLSPYVPSARPVPDGLAVTVEITTGEITTDGTAVARGREVVLTAVRDPATTPLPGLVLPPVEFTCLAAAPDPAAPRTVAGAAGQSGVATYQSPGADAAGFPGSGSLGSGSASAGAPAGPDAAPAGPTATVVTPGADSRPQAAPGPAPRDADIVSTSGTGGRAATTTTTTTTSSSTTRSGSAASTVTPTAAALGAAHTGPSTTDSAGSPVHDLAGAQLLAAESPRSLNTQPETGISVSLPALLWTTGGIILLSLLYALWTSVRLRRLKALTADRAARSPHQLLEPPPPEKDVLE